MKYYLTDAFTDGPFTGGQTVVCILERWPDDETLTGVAAEFNIDCTSFMIPREGFYELRWFTPEGEQGNMKYALVGAAKALMSDAEKGADQIVFETPNGRFTVKRRGELLALELPAIPVSAYPLRSDMVEALCGAVPAETYKGRDLVFVFDSEEQVRALQPDFEKLERLPEGIGVFTAAPGRDTDIAARAFWPKIGINEDTICGSMHANLASLWAQKTGRTSFSARQCSKRSGRIDLEIEGDRVSMIGRAVVSAAGELFLPSEKE